jgi:hypothetical protein
MPQAIGDVMSNGDDLARSPLTVSDLTQRVRAIHHLVQALAITQTEHTQTLDRIRQDVTELRNDVHYRLGRVEALVVAIAAHLGVEGEGH